MNLEQEKEYLDNRLDEQIGWYDKKSMYNQSRHKFLKVAEIILAASIPFVSGMGDRIPCHEWLIGIAGVIIAVSASVSALYRFQENWIQYRTTSEQLKHEKFLYQTKTKPYDDPATAFNRLVERVEHLISKENSQWEEYARKEPEPSKGK